MIRTIIDIFDFKHYSLGKLLPNNLKNDLILWRLLGLSIIYCGILFSVYMEIQFFLGLHSDKILDMYSKIFLGMFLPLFWIVGYTPFSMWYGLGYTLSTLLLILFSILTTSYNLVLGVNFRQAYFSCILLGFYSGYFIYRIISPRWIKHY